MSILAAGLLRVRLGSGFFFHRLILAVPIPKRFAASSVVRFACFLMPITSGGNRLNRSFLNQNTVR